VRGRAISDADVDGAPRVAVVGESMARVLWPGEDPIGQCLKVGMTDSVPCRTVVGIAQDIRSQSIDVESRLYYYYLPAAQWQNQEGGLFVRTRGDAARMAEPVRRRLQLEMPGTSYVTIRPLGDIVDTHLRSWILGATVFTGFGALALLLAAVGLYSVIAYTVTQRRHELGIRIALGATRRGIVRLVVLHAVGLSLGGLAIGGGIALGAARWIEPMLFRQSPYDAYVFAVGGFILLGVAIVASSVPALRAASVDPRTALQAE
jgi:ABC-type antimicrobial peptide transport system permease subunit